MNKQSHYERLQEQMKAAKPKLRGLKKKLLSVGGAGMIPMPEPHTKELLSRGRAFSTRNLLQLEDMETNRCHGNSAILWADKGNQSCIICTGWALNDGIWRQHSWIFDRQGKFIVETTPCRRQKYFGFELTPAEACLFYLMNWEGMRGLHDPPVPDVETSKMITLFSPQR